MARVLRILVLGYYGYSNAGDELVLSGILAGLERTCEGRRYEVRTLSGAPSITEQIHGTRSYPRFSPGALMSALRWCDVLVLGGGSLIQDSTSKRSAAYYIWVMRLAQTMRRRVFVWAQGFGPLSDRRLRKSAARAFSRAKAVTLRDQQSLDELHQLGVPKKLLSLSADPAFLVEPSSEGRAQTLFDSARTGGGILGVALRRWQAFDPELEAIARACAEFAEQSNQVTLFVPFQQPQDVEVSNKCAGLMGKVPSMVLSARPGPGDMMKIISELRMVLGIRLHSLICAAAVGVPFVGIAYDPKVERFCQSAGMPCLKLGSISEGELLDILLSVEANRDEASTLLGQYRDEQRELALQSAEIFWDRTQK